MSYYRVADKSLARPTSRCILFDDENIYFDASLVIYGGARWRSWLRHYATNRQVAVSIPDGVIGIFQGHNPSGRTMALGSTQPLTEVSTRCISWGV
jgi:hypothetical protein